ncbi:MAG TPA: ABC transporter ATP-binding protein [Magnetospirillaceae bacterium]|jgi:branched-chain amino acid transport system ATP-binding protein
MSDMLVECRDIVSGYGEIQVLHGVSITVRKGSITALLGSNGAGKTTLMRTIAGVLMHTAGTLLFAGNPMDRTGPDQRVAAGMALVPEGRLVFPDLSVEENLLLGAYTPRARKGRAARFEKMYAMFPKLRERRRQSAGALSGGEQQMLALARGMMSEPSLLLLDEPSLGLAPQVAAQMFDTIKTIRDDGHSILIVEQDLMGTLNIADYGYVMENGRITVEGSPADLKTDPHVRASYLGGLAH